MIDPHSLSGSVEFDLRDHDALLTWTLVDDTGAIVYQSSDYDLSDDGRTAMFVKEFPAVNNGDTFTIEQMVVISSS